MMKKMMPLMKRGIVILLLLSLLLSLTGCGSLGLEIPSLNSSEETGQETSQNGESSQDSSVETPAQISDQEKTTIDMGLMVLGNRLNADYGKNVMISPLSIQYALTLLLNGAAGQTKEQMEQVLGLSAEEMTDYLRQLYNLMPYSKEAYLSIANSIWIQESEDFSVSRDYKINNQKNLYSDVYEEYFGEGLVDQINAWVSLKTNEMIPEVINELPEDTRMLLVNALAFEGTWEETYNANAVMEGPFYNFDGSSTTVPFMHSAESVYLHNDQFEGMMKYYQGRDYAFVALLPTNGTVEEALEMTSADDLFALLSQREDGKTIFASLPKFEYEYDAQLKTLLQNAGMTDAFDPEAADFTGITNNEEVSLYASDVLHKTYISVQEEGTRAGAVTAVILAEGAAYTQEVITLDFNQPFLYMIIETSTNTPIFMGAYQEAIEMPMAEEPAEEEAEQEE